MIVKKIHDAGKKTIRDMNLKFYSHGVSISMDSDLQTIVIDLSDDKLSIYIAHGENPEGPPIGVIDLPT